MEQETEVEVLIAGPEHEKYVDTFLDTIAGDDTIFIVIKEGYSHETIIDALNEVVPNIK